MLSFGRTQLYWECNELAANESDPYCKKLYGIRGFSSSEKSTLDFSIKFRMSIAQGFRQCKEDPLTQEGILSPWAEIVRTYSRGRLTKENDKLVAISGIAKEMKPLMRCRYLAGLWDFNIVEQLGWSGGRDATRSTIYRAPSWSWASIDGMVDLFEENEPTPGDHFVLAEVLEAHTSLVGVDEFGPVDGGLLLVRSQLIELRREHSIDLLWDVTIDGINLERATVKFDDKQDAQRSYFFCLPLKLSIYTIKCTRFKKPCIRLRSLLLAPTEQTDRYSRVGTMGYELRLDPKRDEDSIEHNFRFDPLLCQLGSVHRTDESDRYSFVRRFMALTQFTII